MSQALQRVIVRLLHDPAYVEAVFSGGPTPELSEAERRMLLATDPRAFGTDPYRRSRSLQALIEELPCAVALATSGGRDMAAVDAFFSSSAFHDSVQGRGVLVYDFGAWLAERVGEVALLELGIARAHRRELPYGEGLTLAAGCWPLRLVEGALARWQLLRRRLGPAPLESLVQGRVEVGGLPPEGPGHEHALLFGGPEGLQLAGSAEGVHALLCAAIRPSPRRALLAIARELGAEPPEDGEVVDGLVEDGLLSPAASP